jgi:hypothetical protein
MLHPNDNQLPAFPSRRKETRHDPEHHAVHTPDGMVTTRSSTSSSSIHTSSSSSSLASPRKTSPRPSLNPLRTPSAIYLGQDNDADKPQLSPGLRMVGGAAGTGFIGFAGVRAGLGLASPSIGLRSEWVGQGSGITGVSRGKRRNDSDSASSDGIEDMEEAMTLSRRKVVGRMSLGPTVYDSERELPELPVPVYLDHHEHEPRDEDDSADSENGSPLRRTSSVEVDSALSSPPGTESHMAPLASMSRVSCWLPYNQHTISTN